MGVVVVVVPRILYIKQSSYSSVNDKSIIPDRLVLAVLGA